MNLTDAATNLRDYLVEQDFAGDDGDIPDHIWQPFCAALQQAESGGSAATNKPRNAISALASEWILKHGMAPAFKSELRAFARWAQKQASVG